MAKNDILKLQGEVVQALSNATFKVTLDNGHDLFCTISGKMRQHFIRVMPGDRVEVEISPYDLNKGRISSRLKAGIQNQNTYYNKKK